MRGLRTALVLGAISAVMAPAQWAHAVCAPDPDALHPHVEALPPNPTLYLFLVPRWDHSTHERTQPVPHVSASSSGIPVRIETTLVSEGDAYHVYRLQVALERGPLTIEYSDRQQPSTYVVQAARSAEHPTLVSAIWHFSKWTCATTDALIVSIRGKAAAYEVAFPDGETFVVAPDSHAGDRVLIGRVGCNSYNIPRNRMDDRKFAAVTVLTSDGHRWPLGRVGLTTDDGIRSWRLEWVSIGLLFFFAMLTRRALFVGHGCPEPRSRALPVARVMPRRSRQ